MTLESLTGIVGVWLAALLTLAIFSFLFKDNPLYKFAEHLVVGVSAGYTAVALYTSSVRSLILDPLAKDFQEGGPFSSLDRFEQLLLHVTPAVLGLMMWARVSPKAAWVGRLPLALFLGVASGLNIPTYLQTYVVQPLRATLLPIVPASWQTWLSTTFAGHALVSLGHVFGFDAPVASTSTLQALNNLVIVGGTFCAIVYFFFSVEHKGAAGKTANVGIWVLMIGFGATFGFTVMSRVSLLVGRFEFLMNVWLQDNLLKLLHRG